MVISWRFLWSCVMVFSVKVIHPGSRTHVSDTLFTFAAFERSIGLETNSSAKICHWAQRKQRKRQVDGPTERFCIETDSRVERHTPTTSLVNETSSSFIQLNSNSRNRRPFGRSN